MKFGKLHLVVKPTAYGIQSPFTGEIFYPKETYWRSAKYSMKKWLEEWDSKYEEKDINDGVVFMDCNLL